MTTAVPRVIVLMGVSGVGKTTVGRALANQLGWRFVEGDAYHPPHNIDKMTRGEALTDADRQPWLAALHSAIAALITRGETAVLTCSALKARYRQQLLGDLSDVAFIWLQADETLIRQRMQKRQGHFMGAEMLSGQLATLEPPVDTVVVQTDAPVETIVADIITRLFDNPGSDSILAR